MKDISILAFFGINTDELESYELEDKEPGRFLYLLLNEK